MPRQTTPYRTTVVSDPRQAKMRAGPDPHKPVVAITLFRRDKSVTIYNDSAIVDVCPP